VDRCVITPGMWVADRFEIEHRAGSGGMGVVFRARDHHTDGLVAFKVLIDKSTPEDTERFMREARLLAGLRHPGVVTYVAHGCTEQGLLYLALEWLEGEDLGQRLRRQPLTVAESLALGRATAEALGAVHGRGIIHRDIKPSNLFLRDGRAEQTTLIDFGIARVGGASWVTRVGGVVGTLQYIAPEQARGERNLAPSADVFALGCVLYECLTGRTPFAGKNQAAVLVRILFEDVPPLRRLRPDLPAKLEALLAHMLAKDPRSRPADGEALVGALAELELPEEVLGATPGPVARARQLAEQHLVSIVMALPRPSVSGDAMTSSPAEGSDLIAERRVTLERVLAPFGVRVDYLGGETVLVSLSQPGSAATDQALQAARVALVVREQLPELAVALATGQGVLDEEGPTGGALDRVGQLILEMRKTSDVNGSPPVDEPPPVLLDKLTAELIDARFEVRRVTDAIFTLEGARTGADEMRRLLGRPTPFVGREQELRLFEMVLASCFAEPSAQALLVVGAPGEGKSRLRHEFVRRLSLRSERVEVMQGHGEPLRADTAYGMLVDLFSRLCGMGEGMDLERRQAQLAARVAQVEHHIPADERQHVVEFLGELCGLSFPDDESPHLKSARQDPRILRDEVKAALITFLRAECAMHPVMLVLEDLHWGDLSTVHLVGLVLRELRDAPLLVLALGRPEVKERFPQLWEGRRVQEVRLGSLNRRASERLVQAILGERATAETLARLVAQSRGHALFLEELIRAVATGEEELPETVLAMLQARFLRLEPEARQVLRAASILGETFWRGGVKELLDLDHEDGGLDLGPEGLAGIDKVVSEVAGDSPSEQRRAVRKVLREEQEEALDHWLERLVQAEAIVPQGRGRFAGEKQFAFRHALLREAAYNLLGEEGRQFGHRIAGAYLERMGERDALVLAEHYERGGERERAAHFLVQAAQQALVSNDLEGVLRFVTRGVACGPHGELLGTLRSVEAWAQLWLGNFQASYEAARVALELLPVGSAGWVSVQGTAVALSGFQGQRERLIEHLRLFAATPHLAGAESAFVEPAMMALVFAAILGLRDLERILLGRLEKAASQLGRQDPRARGLLQFGAIFHWLLAGDLWSYRIAAETGATCFGTAGDRRYLGATQNYAGVGTILLGEVERGRALCREALDLLIQIGEPMARLGSQALFAFALAETGGPEYHAEARQLVEEVVGDPLMPSFWGGMAHIGLATLRADAGEWTAAEKEACLAIKVLEMAPAARPLGYAVLGQILLEQGRLAEARAAVEDGLAQLRAQGGEGLLDAKLHLVAAEVQAALGQEEAARVGLAEAERRLAECAARIPETVARQRFLDHSREHARLRARGFGT
jgi:tetratricopeptide (TPR) repeat protein